MRVADHPWAWALALLLLSGALLIAATGPVPQINFPSDTANYLDACGASAAGLRLQRDFFSPIGPAAILATVLAMRLHGATVTALALGSALTWLGYGAVAWRVAARRLGGGLAAAFALFVAGTAAAPYTLDFGSWHGLSYGMLYNRLAWAAVCIAACSALPTPAASAGLLRSAAGHGACAAWLWLIKPNYLLMQAPFTAWALLSAGARNRPLGAAASLAAGALGAAALVWICVPFAPFGYVREHLAMAEGAPAGLLLYTLRRSLVENLRPVAALLLGWALLAWNRASFGTGAARIGLLAAAMGCCFLANMTNCQFAEFPLWGALGWILASRARRAAGPAWLRGAAAAIGLALGLAYAWQPWASLPYAYVRHRAGRPDPAAEISVASAAWAGMPMRFYPGAMPPAGPADPAGSPGDYAAWLNDGLALLRSVPHPAGAVLCLDWGNPFPFALGARPALGDQIAWHVGRSLGPLHHPAVRGLLGQAAVVMDPKRGVQPDSLAFKREIFSGLLPADFAVMGETPAWRIWVRAPSARQAAIP